MPNDPGYGPSERRSLCSLLCYLSRKLNVYVTGRCSSEASVGRLVQVRIVSAPAPSPPLAHWSASRGLMRPARPSRPLACPDFTLKNKVRDINIDETLLIS
ncbi:hypothetical protein EVAR_88686_1 [Eumeta japonica]|uniref:Uncharacterized protein n=1 Tax=Eumeta variegata TaxID=151549 RepID=A0A4C1Y258_EUMVA|nr:hypothetical protein EVAR_88686_1 [Eumeta japonica]